MAIIRKHMPGLYEYELAGTLVAQRFMLELSIKCTKVGLTTFELYSSIYIIFLSSCSAIDLGVSGLVYWDINARGALSSA